MVTETRKVLSLMGGDRFSVRDPDMSAETVVDRLHAYEDTTRSLRGALAAIGHWGDISHRPLAQKVLLRLLENAATQGGGIRNWLALRYYPSILGFYCFGMAAMAAEKYHLLQPVMHTPVGATRTSHSVGAFVTALSEGILEIERTNVFKLLPEHKRNHVPRSEYMFTLLQPELDDLMFLGHGYETLFDRFEVFLALAHVDISERSWGPIGRYGWKYGGYPSETNPFKDLVAEAKAQGDHWPPIAAGFFGGAPDQFDRVATQFETERLSELHW